MAKANKKSTKVKPVTAKAIKVSKSGKAEKGVLFKVLFWAKRLLLAFFVSSIVLTFIYRYINPFITPLMLIRTAEQIINAEKIRLRYNWVDLNEISPFMATASLAAEDQNFFKHNGFDFDAIQNAFYNNHSSQRLIGGSTISQQTAKNVFLWPGRSWIRKSFEAFFTVLIEFMWSKERILEVYLNVIEMGKGIYGSESASLFYYDKSCRNLTKAESAAIVSIFPLPLKWNPLQPSPVLEKRQFWIRKQSDKIIFIPK